MEIKRLPAKRNNRLVREKIPRNSKCPCGSGLKYKFCHGAANKTDKCRQATTIKMMSLIKTERITRFFKPWRLLLIIFNRPKCPCGSGLKKIYCHGSKSKLKKCMKIANTVMAELIVVEKFNKKVPSSGGGHKRKQFKGA